MSSFPIDKRNIISLASTVALAVGFALTVGGLIHTVVAIDRTNRALTKYVDRNHRIIAENHMILIQNREMLRRISEQLSGRKP